MEKQIYIQCRQHSAVQEGKVRLKDLGEVFSDKTEWAAKAKAMTVCSLQKPGDRAVMSSLFLIEKIKALIPECEVVNLGGGVCDCGVGAGAEAEYMEAGLYLPDCIFQHGVHYHGLSQ